MLRQLIGTVCLSILGLSAFAGETLESLLAKHYEAIGGLDKIRTVKSMRVVGHVQTQTNKSKFRFSAIQGKCRLDMYAHGTHIVWIFDGKRGWEINPILGTLKPQPLNRDQTNELREYMDLHGDLVDWEAKRHRLQYEGLVNEDGQQYHRLAMRHRLGMKKVFFMNPDTYLIEKILKPGPVREKDYLAKIVEYDEVDGLVMFKRIQAGRDTGCCNRVHTNSQPHGFFKEMVYTTRELNPTFKPGLFSVEKTIRMHKRKWRERGR